MPALDSLTEQVRADYAAAEAQIDSGRAARRQVVIDLRENHGLSLREIAELLGLSPTYVRELYHGKKSNVQTPARWVARTEAPAP